MTKLYTVAEAGEVLGIHLQQVRELIWADQLAWVNVAARGKRPRVRVSADELERFIKRRTSSR